MSKKNDKSRHKKYHEFLLEEEQKQQEERKRAQEKREVNKVKNEVESELINMSLNKKSTDHMEIDESSKKKKKKMAKKRNKLH